MPFDFLRRRKEPRKVADKPPPKRRVDKVTSTLLELIFSASRDTHPHEFAAGLHADGDTLTELVIMPTQSGPVSAHMNLWSLPVDLSTVGTVHSHPGSIPFPSEPDKQLFAQFGHTHIIVAEPYAMGTWRAWDHRSQPVKLQVV